MKFTSPFYEEVYFDLLERLNMLTKPEFAMILPLAAPATTSPDALKTAEHNRPEDP